MVTTSSRRAAYISVSNTSGMAEARTVGPVPITWAGNPGPPGGSGCRKRSPRSSSTWAIQSPANRYWFCRATGPSNRIIASTHGAYFALMRNSGSAQFWLPQYVTASSITTILRWFRRSMRPRSGRSSALPIGRAVASRTPAAAMALQCSEPRRMREPSASAIARHATRAPAARFSASTTLSPLVSGSQM